MIRIYVYTTIATVEFELNILFKVLLHLRKLLIRKQMVIS